MDRTNNANAKVSGMDTALKLTSNQYSVALVVYFVGYVVFEVPSNLVLGRTRPSIFLPSIMIIWGVLTCLMSVIKSYAHLVVLRILVGSVEAGFAPGDCSFFRPAVLSGTFGSLIAAGIMDGLDGAHGIEGWRWLFIVEGAATIGFALIALFILPDFPATSKGLSEREREIAVARLASENSAARDMRTWAFVVGYMVIVGSSTLTYFYPTLVKGLFGTATIERINLLTVPIYGAAFVATGITSYFGEKVPQWRELIISCWLAFALVCSIIVCAVYNHIARYVLMILMACGLWATNGGTLAYASSAFAVMHPQARGVALALVNAMGNLAQSYGSYLFPSSDSPKYIMGFSVISAMLALGVVVFAGLHVWFRRRAKLFAEE
ncbi:hypothetical protein N7488_002266 [Penicillium malachiteum]|nr:hypothetical protein N7488_002266 [Penicillium malachiteum]